ncbi:CocE/NonD family hydrolase [Aminobacter sp. MSH1]|uniref:CocE/NonD family hydrolase n=1 Tax=Aminobacter sp. MSH1 TaxID=374606 RepID=UPI000D352CDD|nr:CocE/NonD family hydrolase [Aminobacter sp. MSH1]
MSVPLHIEQSRIEDGDILIDKDVPIQMKDGAILYCNVFRPNRAGKFPPIISFSPYGKDSDVAVDFKRYWDFVLQDHPDVASNGSTGKYLTWEVPDPERWVPDGYAIVVVDARGTGKSPGYYDLMSALETRDVYDVVEWSAKQAWSNGRVGMLGVSYLAIKQWQVAALQPPSLAAIVPWEGLFDHYRDNLRHGGIFSSFFQRLLWDTQITINQNGNADTPYRDRFTGQSSTGLPLNESLRKGNLQNTYRDASERRFDDSYYANRTPRADRIKVPVLSAGNWGGLGLHLRGNIWGYETVASEEKWLEMHTDTHFGSMYLPEAVKLQKRFLGHYLKGEDTGWTNEPSVLLTVRDPRGEFRRKESSWPIASTQWMKHYLDFGNSSVGPDRPSDSAATFEATKTEVTVWTAPFGADEEFTGPIAARIFASSSTEDMDLFLTLRIFDKTGTEFTFIGANDREAPVSQGWLRASHRALDPERTTAYRPYHPHDREEKLTPGEVYQLDVEIWPTSIVFPKGWRMALTIGGSDFARPGATGLMKGSGIFMHDESSDRPTDVFAGTTTLHSGPSRRSYLLLPSIPRERK